MRAVGQQDRRPARRRPATQWAAAAAVLLGVVVVAFRGEDDRAVMSIAILAVGVVATAPAGVPRLAACVRRWQVRACSPLALSGPVPWVGAPEGVTAPGAVGPPVGSLHWRGRLSVVLDVRCATSGRPPPGDDRLLTPLLDAAGIVVESIQWVHLAAGDRGRVTVSRPAGNAVSAAQTLLVLRIDPFRNRDSIRARGGGDLGLRRLVAITVTRAAALLRPYGLRPRLLDVDAALRTMAELAAGMLTAPSGAGGRWSVSEVREGRRSLATVDGVHRLLCWSRPGPADLPARLVAAAAVAGGPTVPDSSPSPSGQMPSGQVVITHWTGPVRHGMRTTGVVRLSARNPVELDRLERQLCARLGPYSGGLRVAVDDQWPTFLDSLPWGGPTGRPV